ncbi:MAG: hypothetical protein IT385_27250 [Deltaproteobacteria bacterium]|nr:hypothetical protein [Deltaproteobacteria bacterium]
MSALGRHLVRWALSSALLWTCALRQASAFEDPAPGSVSASTVKLPAAPGSLEGLGQAGEVSVFTGQYNYVVPLDLPPGQAGFGPGLALAYDGGLGNGVVGLGWGFSVPHIQRSTRFGVPSYTTADELELVGIGGGGRLVLLTCGDYAGEYRVEGHGQAIRVVQSGMPTTFMVTTSDGTRYLLSTRVTHPESGETFAWYVSEIRSVDQQPSKTVYFTYTDPTSATPTASSGHALLTALEWGPTPSSGPGAGSRAYRVDFELAPRPDPTESYRAGFRRILRHRLESVVVRSYGSVRKTYTLAYDDTFVISRLASITIEGTEASGLSLPPIAFEYGAPNPTPTVEQLSGAGGWNLAERGVTLQDVDGDGLVDLARYELGNRAWRKNLGGALDKARPLPGGGEWDLADLRFMDLDGDLRPEMVYIANDTWRVHRMTLAPSDPEAPGVSGACGPAAHVWSSVAEWPGTFMLPLVRSDTVFVDIDGDDRVDVLQATATRTLVRWGRDDGLSEPDPRPLVSELDSFLEPGDDSLHFMDMQGDGLVDAVWLADGWIKVYPGRGDGTFETRAVRHCYPWNWQGDPNDGPTLADSNGNCRLADTEFVDMANIRLVDLDRDGMVDLVRVSAGYVYWYPGYWLADAQDGSLPFGGPSYLPRPDGARYDDVVTFADLNGNGSTDVVWSSQLGLFYMDLAGPATRGMLTAIDNGLGAVTTIEYTTSALTQLAACEVGAPWSEAFPVNMAVPAKVTTSVPGEPDRVAFDIVRDGFWDTEERRFGGFLAATRVASALPHDDQSFDEDDLVTTIDFERGDGMRRVLRGMAWRTVRSDGAGDVFDEAIASHDALVVDGMACGDPKLRVAVTHETTTIVDERTCEPRFVRQVFDHDGYGNVVVATSLGEVGVDGVDLDDVLDRADETESTTAYVSNWDDWVLFKPCEQVARTVVASGSPTVRSKTVTVYDSPTLSPTTGCVGGAADGRARGVYGWLAEESRWVKQSDATYDVVGHPTDVFASGVRRTLSWDADKMFPVSERMADLPILEWDVTLWDKTLGIPIEVVDPSGRAQKIEVDGLGRITGTFGGFAGALVRLTTLVYVLTGTGPVPRIDATLHEGGAIPDVVSAAVFNAVGEPRFSAVKEASTSWVIDGYRRRNERGLTFELVRPHRHPSSGLPTSEPSTSVARQTIAYDPLGRAVRQTLPQVPRYPSSGDQSAAERVTSYAPLVVTTTSTELEPVVTAHDGLGRMVRTQRTIGGVVEEVQAAWDAAGRMVGWAVDPTGANVTHTFVYDTLGRLVFATDPDAGDRWHTWTDANQLATTTNAVDDVIAYGYDVAGRLVERAGISAATSYDEAWTFVYDAISAGDPPSNRGLLMGIIGPDDDSPILYYDYDDLGRMWNEIHSVRGHDLQWMHVTNQRTFSRSGKELSRKVIRLNAEQLRLEYDYDPAGRLRWIGWATGGGTAALLWEALELTPSGATTFERLGNQLGTKFTRDALDQVSSVTVRDTNSTQPGIWNRTTHAVTSGYLTKFNGDYNASSSRTRYGVGIARNAYGAIREVTDTWPIAGQQSRYSVFEYDGAARLTLGNVGGYTFEYEYDALQNMVRREQVSPPTLISTMLSGDYTHGEGGASPRQLTSVGATAFEYDAAGRMTLTGPGGSSDTTMVFDAFDRVREVDEPGGSAVTQHRYGFDGERIATRWATGEIERYFGEGLSDRDGRLELHVGLGGPRLIASVRHPVSGGEQAVTYLVQGVGPGPAVVANMAGERLEERFFEPYGAELVGYDEWLEPHGWNGKMVDPSTRWSDHGARWLGTRFGRWLSVDALMRSPNGLQRHRLDDGTYSFVGGSPTQFWDPDGNIREQDNPLDWAKLDELRDSGAGPALGRALEAVGRAIVSVYEYLDRGIWEAHAVASCSGGVETEGGGCLFDDPSGIGTREVTYERRLSEGAQVTQLALDVALGRAAAKATFSPPVSGPAISRGTGRPSFEDLLRDARPGRVTKGRSRQWEKTGGLQQAQDDFDALAPRDVREIPDGRIGELSDGRTVVVRSKSTDKRPTLEVQSKNSKVKIRYDE